MSIAELGQALGLRPSTLRHWEDEGLLRPERIATRAGAARRYPATAIRDSRIVASLRAGGYRIPDVRRAIVALRELGDASTSRTALEARLADIAARMTALLVAGGLLAELLERDAGRSAS